MKREWHVTMLALGLLVGAPAVASGETLGEVYRRVNASVVVIRARGQEVTATGVERFREIGSGVLISRDGKIATAAHVVNVMDEVTVEFLGEDPVPAKVIGSEVQADISLVQASVVPRDAVVAKLVDSDQVRVGDPVFIVGAPYGLSHSLSTGVISARWEPNTVTRDFPLAEFFQTDAVINTGNSGGPMFTYTGELIGIVSHNITKSGGSEGLGFVVTSSSFKKHLIDQNRRWFGIEVMHVTGETAEALKVPQPSGYLVKQVAKNSISEKIGLRGGDRVGIVEGRQLVLGGDILLSILGVKLDGDTDVVKARKTLETLKPGDEIHVTVLRDDKVVRLAMKFTGW